MDSRKLVIVIAFIFISFNSYSEIISQRMKDQVCEIGASYGVPKSVVLQLMAEESGGDCRAVSHKTDEGYRSLGLFQLYNKPGNIEWLLDKFWKCRKIDFDVYDPLDNAGVALPYLASLHDRFGNWYHACVYFNHGSIYGASVETKAYARRIINAK